MSVDAYIELGTCGMGMPVIRSHQKLRNMGLGEILEVSSAHPEVNQILRPGAEPPDKNSWI